MSRYFNTIRTAVSLVNHYTGEKPFVFYLKNYFSLNKKHGSRDRKLISELCYNFFRVGHCFKSIDENNMATAFFMCRATGHPVLAELYPHLNERVHGTMDEKAKLVNINLQKIFPFQPLLSSHLDAKGFTNSLLKQPNFFLRCRPDYYQIVQQKLKAQQIEYTVLNEECICLPNKTKSNDVIFLNKEAVVQDFSSQQVFNIGLNLLQQMQPYSKLKVWDCCAASGGKSILLYDILQGQIEITASDIRPSILKNLQTRFYQAGVKSYHTFTADLTKHSDKQPSYDIIILDAPCSGSGTWSRTPEQLYYFKESTLAQYTQKQLQIAVHAAAQLQEEGLFFYITCSVFKSENEAIVNAIEQQTALKCIEYKYLPGWSLGADTLFTSVFQKK
ncbi:MAG: hypothetical protein ABS68_12070 [Niastella sp. SCN 39-18]|nr:hypothetical protein [Sphingobacteriales bacterium]ODT51696.1 MAG: hypothetical protein ABS68_12070 [Niastella sp. SCN 39-18]OJW09724.1 MAG: hypothetical protein BGO53_07675 [Sphingobacteriales bacterium 39-19]